MSAEKYPIKEECESKVQRRVFIMRQGNYMVYKMTDSNQDEVTLFFLPEKEVGVKESLMRKMSRLANIQSYTNNGFRVYAVAFVDKETYLNQRLDSHVRDYCITDQKEQETRSKKYLMDREVYEKTIEMYEDLKWTYLKQISMTIRRLIREDFNVENEIALCLYDTYRQQVL